MGRELLCQGGGFQQLLWSAVFGVDSGDSKGALSQSACLVQHHDSGIGQGLQIVAPLHQDTLLGRSAQPAKKGQGNGDDQGAWAGYDQEVQGTGDPHPPPASQQGGKQPQGQGSKNHSRGIVPGEFGNKMLRLGLFLAGVLHQVQGYGPRWTVRRAYSLSHGAGRTS